VSISKGDNPLEIRYSEKASKQLINIAKGDKKGTKLILETIEKYASDPLETHDIKILKGELGELKRLRAGHYRIIFTVEEKLMSIYEIKHRQEAYK